MKRSNNNDVGGGKWETVAGKIEFGEELASALADFERYDIFNGGEYE